MSVLVGIARMRMLMLVCVFMLMAVDVLVFVSVRHPIVRMFVAVSMRVLMLVIVVMLVLSFHLSPQGWRNSANADRFYHHRIRAVRWPYL